MNYIAQLTNVQNESTDAPEINRSAACAFTGHRRIPAGLTENISKRLYLRIRALIKRGYTDFICGGALGFDTLAAITVINLKKEYPEIRLFIAVPHPEQSKAWKFSDRALYTEILKRCDRIFVICEEYTPYCMTKRNRFMIDSSSVCISYLTENSGGTYSTVKYAEKKGLHMLNIADEI